MLSHIVSFALALLFILLPCHHSLCRTWQRLENCELINNPFNDGDSFHVRANGKERIFRLYFVDSPESSDHNKAMKSRVDEQAKEFGLPPSEVIKTGKAASKFTASILSSAGSFTVITRWENARGDSDMKRNYAYVLANGRGLDEQLVEAGFARVLGYPVDIPKTVLPPNGIKGFEHRKKLLKIQDKAKKHKKGVWQKNY